MPPLNATIEPSSFESDYSGHSTMTSDQPKKTLVKFSSVTVREYDRIVGDHPDCKVGPPITIGWEYTEKSPRELDDYESSHTRRNIIRLSSITRKNILHNVFGIPEEEIRLAEKEVQKIMKQRTNSKNQTKASEKTEAFVQSAKRKLRRALSTKSLLNAFIQSQKNMFPMVVQ